MVLYQLRLTWGRKLWKIVIITLVPKYKVRNNSLWICVTWLRIWTLRHQLFCFPNLSVTEEFQQWATTHKGVVSISLNSYSPSANFWRNTLLILEQLILIWDVIKDKDFEVLNMIQIIKKIIDIQKILNENFCCFKASIIVEGIWHSKNESKNVSDFSSPVSDLDSNFTLIYLQSFC